MSKKEAHKAPASNVQQRTYRDAVEFNHDLFRLNTAAFKRNMAWSKKMKPIWEEIDHKHFFHTFDSDGRKLTRSNSTAGHFHEVEVIDNGDGNVPTVKAGPAMEEKLSLDEDTGTYKKKAYPLTGNAAHTHKMEWVASDRMKTRKSNGEAATLQSTLLQRETPQLSQEEKANLKQDMGDRE